jgi:hypothetical protein
MFYCKRNVPAISNSVTAVITTFKIGNIRFITTDSMYISDYWNYSSESVNTSHTTISGINFCLATIQEMGDVE